MSNTTKYYVLAGVNARAGLTGVFHESKFGTQVVVSTLFLANRFTNRTAAQHQCDVLNEQHKHHGYNFKVQQLTIALAQKALRRDCAMFLCNRDGEFRVTFGRDWPKRVQGEESAYYTDDIADALDTGRAMAQAQLRQIRALAAGNTVALKALYGE